MAGSESPSVPIHSLLRGRRSVRAFASTPLAEGDLEALLEAARWAPSSFNAQPWRFLLTHRQVDSKSYGADPYSRILGSLDDPNQVWAQEAPVLGCLLVAPHLPKTESPNPHAQFDAGGALAHFHFEALARGYQLHAMAGFDPRLIRARFEFEPELEPLVCFALGRPGKLEDLPEVYQEYEQRPRVRKSRAEIQISPRTKDCA